jgi:hypothetical protein
MLILVIATFAWLVQVDFPVMIWYRPSDWGIVAMVCPDGFVIVHIPLLNVTAQSSSSSCPIEINIKAISGAYIASWSMVFVHFDPFGSSICTLPIPMAFRV